MIMHIILQIVHYQVILKLVNIVIWALEHPSIHPGISVGDNVKTGIGSKIFRDILNNEIHKE